MRDGGLRALTWGGVALLVLVAGCGRQGATADGADDFSHERQLSDLGPKDDPEEFNGAVELDDGRRVSMHYRKGKGLVEQHYSPEADGWSKPRLVYRTATDACQSITLTARGGTVAAIADFGTYCYDGEPPTESIAAVGVGDLGAWKLDVTKDFDGWSTASVSADGGKATFTRESTTGPSTLRWTRSGGFGTVRTAASEESENLLPKDYLGTWERDDGRQRLTIAEPRPGEATATFTSTGGAPCTAEAELIPAGTEAVDIFSPATVTKGEKTRGCPPATDTLSFTMGGDADTLVLGNGPDYTDPDHTYTRVE